MVAHLVRIGTVAILSSVICILLVLQWGGITYLWGSSQIIGLLVGSALLFAVFIGDQIYLGDGATLVPRVFKFRSIWTAGAYNFCYGSYFFTITYFVPIYFQAVKGEPPSYPPSSIFPSADRLTPTFWCAQIPPL